MAKNKVILTSGTSDKRECRYTGADIAPGIFVMPTTESATTQTGVNGSTGLVTVAAASYTDQIAVADLSSVNGMSWETKFADGDQIAVLYPTNGCIINVRCGSTADIAIGTKIAIGADGKAVSTSGSDAIGVANENWVAADYTTSVPTIKVEVLK